MVQRITVTIPDDLHRDLQEVKSGFNVSKTCQEAIAKEIRMIKAANSEDLITYLKQSKEDFIMNNREIGKGISLEYINDKILDYESFMLIEKLHNDAVNFDRFSSCYDDLKEVLDEHQDAIWVQLEESFNDQVTGKSPACYNAIARGFVEGVMEIWSEIKDEVE